MPARSCGRTTGYILVAIRASGQQRLDADASTCPKFIPMNAIPGYSEMLIEEAEVYPT